MNVPDSLRLFVDIKNNSTPGYDYTPIFTVIISGIVSILLAYLTSKWAKKRELDELIKDNQKLNYNIKQALLSIETENYRKLFELKLASLKEIKKISFDYLERNPNNYDSIDEFLNNFPFSEIKKFVYNFILEFSYIFPIEITSTLKEIHHDSEFALNNMSPNEIDLNDFAKSIHDKLKNVIILIENDMKIDFKSIENKIK